MKVKLNHEETVILLDDLKFVENYYRAQNYKKAYDMTTTVIDKLFPKIHPDDIESTTITFNTK